MNERLQQLKEQLSFWQVQSPINQSKIDAIQAEIALLEAEPEQVKVTAEPRVREFEADFDAHFGVTFLNDAIQDLLDGKADSVRAELHNRYQDQLEEKDRAFRDLEQKFLQLQERHSKQAEELHTVKIERDDFESRFKAAEIVLKEKDTELEGKELVIKAKQEQIEQLQHERDNAPAPSVKPIPNNMDNEWLKAKLAEDRAKKPKIWDVKPLDDKQSRYGAVDEQGNPVEFGYLELGRFNVQEGPFCAIPANVGQEPLEQTSSVETGSSFPGAVTTPTIPAVNPPATYIPSIGGRLDEGKQQPEQMVSETVTRAEFEALKARVDAIEAGKAHGEVA